MEIYATLRHKMDINPLDVIEKLKNGFLEDHNRWIEDKDGKFYIMGDCYHNSSEIIREISEDDVKYFDALKTIEKYLSR